LKVKSSSFAEFKALDTLFLAQTNLNEWIEQENLFENLPYLRWLDISFNNLQVLNVNSFSPLPNLIKLDISNANLTQIVGYENMMKLFPELNVIKLSGNEWNCNFLDNFLKYFEDFGKKKLNGIACKNTTRNGEEGQQSPSNLFPLILCTI
jgi:hypothetical protein